jgi:hypothetical protein
MTLLQTRSLTSRASSRARCLSKKDMGIGLSRENFSHRLQALPTSLAQLPKTEKLDLGWNKLTRLTAWIEHLEQRGCTVLL